MQTKLTVIIPHYNWPERLEILLNTIPNLPEIQVIVIDDNSDRDIIKLQTLMKEYSQRNVIFLKNDPQKQSAGACRNIGINYAKSDWVLFADADDYFLPGWYEVVSKYFATNNEIVYFPPTSVRLDTNEISIRHKAYEEMILNYLDKQDLQSELRLRYFYTQPVSKMVRLDFLKNNNICFEEILVSNDVMFSVKCGYFVKKFECSRDIIYVLTQSKDSLTNKRGKEMIDIRYQARIRRGDFFFEKLSPEEIRQLSIQSYGISLLYEVAKKGYIGLAIKYFTLLCKTSIPIFNLEILSNWLKKILIKSKKVDE